jgi:trypsin-like peptidase
MTAMLAQHVAAVRNSIVVVLRFAKSASGAVRVSPVGTACHVGQDTFVTAGHLFDSPPLAADEVVRVGFVPAFGVGSIAVVLATPASVDYRSERYDLALMTVPGFGSAQGSSSRSAPPWARVSGDTEPEGRSVFSYGFATPKIQLTNGGPVVRVAARASPCFIRGRYEDDPAKYELDGQAYPGESGAPVFRARDHVVIAIVQGSRLVDAPLQHFGQVRGPTIAAPLTGLSKELARRGIPLSA